MDGLDQPFQTQNTLTVAELLKAWTIGGQKIWAWNRSFGTLEAGKLADITVFDRNLLQTETKGSEGGWRCDDHDGWQGLYIPKADADKG